MKRHALLALAAAASLAACDGLKEALSAHQETVARAGGQELSVTRLAELLGNSRFPIGKPVAHDLASLWVDYQLLAQAAVKGDSLTDPKAIDAAMWQAMDAAKVRKYYELVSKGFAAGGDSTQAEARYANGEILAARHILLQAPEGMPPAARDSMKRRLQTIRAGLTPANFAAMAQKYSQDGSASNGGALGVFPKGAMVPVFEQALVALKPGEISPVVESQFGYHVIYRQPFAEVRQEVMRAANQRGVQTAESTFVARMEAGGNVVVKPNAAKDIKAMAGDLDAHRDDRTVVATSKAGDVTIAKVVRLLDAAPPDQRIADQLKEAPDSVIPLFVRQVVRNDLILRQADSAKVTLDTGEVNNMRRAFTGIVTGSWMGLRVAPKLLADSAKSASDRSRLASARVESYLDALLQQRAQFIDVPKPLETALREKYEYKLNSAGIDRAVEQAQKIRASTDSLRSAGRPASQVPMPNVPQGAPGPQGAASQGAAPARP